MAVGALGAEVGLEQVTDPGIVAVVSEDSGAAGRTALMYIDIVGAGALGFGELVPEGCIVLLEPPAQRLDIDRTQRRVLERLCGLGGVPIASQRPAAGPLSPIVALALAQLVKRADLDDAGVALLAAFGAEGIVAVGLRARR